MALPRAQVSDGLLSSLADFEDLIRSLDDEQWATPSRCEGWTVGDVARHVIGGMADVAALRLEGLGTPEVTKREVDERAGRSATELADECAEVTKAAAGLLPMFDDEAWAGPSPGGFEGTLGDGVEALWYDNWLHAEDIRAALGRPVDVGTHLPGAVSHVTFELRKRGWSGDAPSTPDDQVAWILSATGRTPLTDGLIDIYADA